MSTVCPQEDSSNLTIRILAVPNLINCYHHLSFKFYRTLKHCMCLESILSFSVSLLSKDEKLLLYLDITPDVIAIDVNDKRIQYT